jgi:hypothetical protein
MTKAFFKVLAPGNGIANKEYQVIADEEYQDIANEEYQDIANEEYQDIADEEPQGIADEEPQGIADEEPQDVANKKYKEIANKITSRIMDIAVLPVSYILRGEADDKIRQFVAIIIELTNGATAEDLVIISEKIQ